MHTIMEVYRVAAGMPLVRVLPSAQDEVNAAAFHPFKVGRASLPRRALRLSYHAEACRHISTSNCVQAHCMAEHSWGNRGFAASFQARNLCPEADGWQAEMFVCHSTQALKAAALRASLLDF